MLGDEESARQPVLSWMCLRDDTMHLSLCDLWPPEDLRGRVIPRAMFVPRGFLLAHWEPWVLLLGLVVSLSLLCLPPLTVFTLFQGLHGPYPFGQS